MFDESAGKRRAASGWKSFHVVYCSVVGIYNAFVAEEVLRAGGDAFYERELVAANAAFVLYCILGLLWFLWWVFDLRFLMAGLEL